LGPNLVRNFKGLPNCHLKAMCDVSEARLQHMKSLYSDVEALTDFEHLLNGLGLDAVVVAALSGITIHWLRPACLPVNIR
jgi:predicted dehydrogenase